MNRWLTLSSGFVAIALLSAGLAFGQQPKPDCKAGAPEKVEGQVVRKGTGGEDGYSGFSMRHPTSGDATPTELEAVLRRGGVSRLVICGLATDYCVKETAIDGLDKGFEVLVLPEAVRAVELEPGDARRAIEAVRGAGAVIEG